MYNALAAVVLAWTMFLMFQMKLFVIAGTVSQWYFSPQGDAAVINSHATMAGAPASSSLASYGGSSGPGAYSDVPVTGNARTMLSVRHALGPSFGSLALGSAVLTLVAYIRRVRSTSLNTIMITITVIMNAYLRHPSLRCRCPLSLQPTPRHDCFAS